MRIRVRGESQPTFQERAKDGRRHQAELRDRRAGLVALGVFAALLALGMVAVLLE